MARRWGHQRRPAPDQVLCECGASLSLQDLFQPGRLGHCQAEWPWIADGRDPQGCAHMLKLLTRTAMNTYFPQVARVISLPPSLDQLAALIESVWSVLQSCVSVDEVSLARRFNPQVGATLEGYCGRGNLGENLWFAEIAGPGGTA